MRAHKVTAQWWDHATLWNADDPHLEDAGHTTDGGRVFGITRTRHAECDDYGCKPVVVIDPEDREQVERLTSLIHEGATARPYEGGAVEATQAALREFADPTPPKPEEPTGDGAVVEDAVGNRWVRIAGEAVDSPPWRHRGHSARWWDNLTAVRVLSEGVRDA